MKEKMPKWILKRQARKRLVWKLAIAVEYTAIAGWVAYNAGWL